MKSDLMITVGKVLKPHGIKGELKILPLTDYPEERYQKGKCVYISKKKYEIEKCTPHGSFMLLRLKHINDRDLAEELRGNDILIPKEDLHQLEPGQFYRFQLVGLEVFDEKGEYLGKIEEVLETGSNDVLLIKEENGNELLIPALKKIVKKIDIAGGQMVVSLLPGLR